MAIADINKGKSKKDDEFYTRYEDIDKELINYKNELEGKIIYLPCDDYRWSNFYKYFKNNFYDLKLKKLVATHLEKENSTSVKVELFIDENNNLTEVFTSLNQNGDFRNQENLELIKSSDLIITNPPFSLFRDFYTILKNYNKKFIIVCRNIAATYKCIEDDFVKLIVWYGYTSLNKFFNKNFEFKTVGSLWMVNVGIHPRLNFYIPLINENSNFPKYDNYDAINVDKIVDIPKNYNNTIGVPFSYLFKHNPKQFKLIKIHYGDDNKCLRVNGKRPFVRVLIKKII